MAEIAIANVNSHERISALTDEHYVGAHLPPLGGKAGFLKRWQARFPGRLNRCDSQHNGWTGILGLPVSLVADEVKRLKASRAGITAR
jgi:hypothetical protein